MLRAMEVTPFIIGSGRAAQALTESFAILGATRSQFKILPARRLSRGQPLRGVTDGLECPVLVIANPHALHAPLILEGEHAGFRLIVVEKPACVTLEQAEALRRVRTPVAVCHVYRQTWGLKTLRQMIAAGELGELIALEGRYWQSSIAQRSLGQRASGGWKNDPLLSGPHDTLLDVGVHWADAALYLVGESPRHTKVWLSHANAEAPHRDSHVHLQLDFASGVRGLGSISKNIHGAANHFEVNALGTKKSVTWTFLDPDRLRVGSGSSDTQVCRANDETGSRHSPFHALGWLEGYLEILERALQGLASGKLEGIPQLSEHLDLVGHLLQAAGTQVAPSKA
jgi:predicted dehydrogenase